MIGVENNLCGSWNLVVGLPFRLVIGESQKFRGGLLDSLPCFTALGATWCAEGLVDCSLGAWHACAPKKTCFIRRVLGLKIKQYSVYSFWGQRSV